MTVHQARIFGRLKTLKATGIIVALTFVVFFIMETRDDFANGILFFIEEISNIHLLVILGILFGLTYLFGGKAGTEVILGRKNIFLTSIKYVVIIIVSIITYAAIIGVIKDKNV